MKSKAFKAMLQEAKECFVCMEPWLCADCDREVPASLGWCKWCSGKRTRRNPEAIVEDHLRCILREI
jgi:hypothetical protein